jgi:hypothetical protein
MRRMLFFVIAALTIAQPQRGTAQDRECDPRKAGTSDVTVSREYVNGVRNVSLGHVEFFLNNETDRLLCVWTVGKSGGAYGNDAIKVLLPHERHKFATRFNEMARAIADGPGSWWADVRLLIAPVPGMCRDQPSIDTIQSLNEREIELRCQKAFQIISRWKAWED